MYVWPSIAPRDEPGDRRRGPGDEDIAKFAVRNRECDLGACHINPDRVKRRVGDFSNQVCDRDNQNLGEPELYQPSV